MGHVHTLFIDSKNAYKCRRFLMVSTGYIQAIFLGCLTCYFICGEMTALLKLSVGSCYSLITESRDSVIKLGSRYAT